jgi:hypothetical protein
VQTFVDIYPTLAELDASAEPARKLTRVPTHAPTAAPAVGLVQSSPARTNVFRDIAGAPRNLCAYEIAQAMGSSLGVADTMALISSKLANMSFCCALFLYNDEAETLRCRFATGVEAENPAVDDPQRRRPHRLGRAQPAAARQRAAGHRPRSRRLPV